MLLFGIVNCNPHPAPEFLIAFLVLFCHTVFTVHHLIFLISIFIICPTHQYVNSLEAESTT